MSGRTAGDPNAATARVQRIGLGVILALGALDAWRYLHYQANPDGVSYLDIAVAFAADGPGALVNGYWSPLLPALIGAAYRLVPPTLDSMYLIAHVVLVLLFILASLAFHRLLTVVRARVASVADAPPAARAAAVIVAWSAYLLFVLKGIGIQLITPDIGVAAVVFWLAAESFAFGAAPQPARRWAVAGVVLAIGYWWKAILFPVGVVWFGIVSAVALRRRDPLRGPMAGALAYGALALALIVPLSRHTGRATFGETGRLNYLWYVNAAPYVWERCLPAAIGEEAAAPFGAVTRATLISERPVTCALSSPMANATMPLWDDPSRFYRDAHTRLDVPRQLRTIRTNVRYVLKDVGDLGPVLFLAAIIAGVAAVAIVTVRGLRARHRFAIPPDGLILAALVCAPVAFYLLVYVEFRHLAPFFAVAIVLVPGLVLAAAGARGRLVVGLLAALALSDVAWRTSTQTLFGLLLARGTLTGRVPERIPHTQFVARALRDAGLAPGTRVASLNNEWNAEWAQLSGLRIRAHVPEWTTPITGVLRTLRDPCARADWDAALRTHGIAAVVARIPEGLPPPPEFDRLAGTNHFLHRVPAEAPPGTCGAPPTRSSSGTAAR